MTALLPIMQTQVFNAPKLIVEYDFSMTVDEFHVQ